MGKRVALGVALAVVAVGVGLRLTGVELTPASVAAAVRKVGASTWGMPVYALLYLVFTSVAVPGIVFHVAAGVIWGFGPAVVLNVAVSNVASWLQFAAGRLFGAGPLRSLVEKRGIARHFEKAKTEGIWVMVAVRQLPLPGVAVNVAAGSSGMPFWHFLIGSGLGGLVPQVVWTWFAGEVFYEPKDVRPEVLVKAVGAGAIALLLAVGSRAVVGRLAARARRRAAGVGGGAADGGKGPPP